jgi:hypothetical protein
MQGKIDLVYWRRHTRSGVLSPMAVNGSFDSASALYEHQRQSKVLSGVIMSFLSLIRRMGTESIYFRPIKTWD